MFKLFLVKLIIYLCIINPTIMHVKLYVSDKNKNRNIHSFIMHAVFL